MKFTLIALTLLLCLCSGCSTGYRARISLAWQALTFEADAESPAVVTNSVAR